MDHWGIADVLLDCYVDLLTMEMVNENYFNNSKMTRIAFFKKLLSERHIKCKEQQIFEDEIHDLEEELKRIKN